MLEENARTAERKIRQPPDFTGDRLEASNFLNTCRTYLRINKNAYTTDEDKIIFVLSFMEGGTAGPWKNAIMEEAYAAGTLTVTPNECTTRCWSSMERSPRRRA